MLIDNKEIKIRGKLIKTAQLAEEWYDDVEDPESLISGLNAKKAKADIFTFWQAISKIIRVITTIEYCGGRWES